MRTLVPVWLVAALTAAGVVVLASPATAAPVSCDDLILVGHRGYGRGEDENTLENMQRGVDGGADVVELDVRRLRDGALGIMHDARVHRTTDGRGLVSRMRWAKFRTLSTASGYHPPSLGMVIKAMGPQGVGLQLHLKVKLPDSKLERIARMLRNNGFSAGSVQLNSGKLGLLQRAERLTGLPTGYTYNGAPSAERIEEVASYGVDMAVMPWAQVTPEWVDYADGAGVELGARGTSIEPQWATSTGVRRLVVDRWEPSCATQRA